MPIVSRRNFFILFVSTKKREKEKKTKLMRDLVSYFVPYAAGSGAGGGGWI
jgi:hypothetical protein